MGALNVKNAEAHRLAAEIAAETGDGLTGAVPAARREMRAALAAARGPDPARLSEILRIARETGAEARAAGATSDPGEFYDDAGPPR
jgi:hypothetical protein